MILKTIEEQTSSLSCNSSTGVWESEHNETFNCFLPGTHITVELANASLESEESAEPELPAVNYTKIEEDIDEMARIINELNKMEDTSSFMKTGCNLNLLLFLLWIFAF